MLIDERRHVLAFRGEFRFAPCARERLGAEYLDVETVRRQVENQVGSGPDPKMAGTIPYTPMLKKVLALAVKEAKALRHTYVGTEHLLLGLLGVSESVAAKVLTNLNVNAEKARQEILKELDPNFDGWDEAK